MSQAALPRRDRLPHDTAPLLFIAIVWLVQSKLLLDYLALFTVNIPYADEWEMVPYLTGRTKVTLGWLWAQHNEHRIPLPRLVYLAIEKLASFDFRAGAYFCAGLLALLSIGCCATARRLRGGAAYTDAFFPLMLLHWGQAENLTWSFQIVFVLSSAIALLALMLLLSPGTLSLRAAIGLGLCTLALPLTGGATLAFVPALALCTVLSGWQLFRVKTRGGILVMILGAVASRCSPSTSSVMSARPTIHRAPTCRRPCAQLCSS